MQRRPFIDLAEATDAKGKFREKRRGWINGLELLNSGPGLWDGTIHDNVRQMDSLTQLVLGAAVTAVCVPREHRRAALGVGAALGTLPDLDVIPLSLLDLNPIEKMTWHRAASHSLLVLPVIGWLLWFALRRGWRTVREAPLGWFIGIQLGLLTHPLLDALTIYGTQLWWPFRPHPVMSGNLFIIDPLFTLPLLLAGMITFFNRSRRVLVVGLALSLTYTVWSLTAQVWVDHVAARALTPLGLAKAPRFVSAAPFSTLLWRVVVRTPEGYLEGYHSLVADRNPIRFKAYESSPTLLAQALEFPAGRELRWFNRGFMIAEEGNGQLVLSDLRMGVAPDYAFRFAIAERDPLDVWREIRPKAAPRPDMGRRFRGIWTRIWNEPR